MGQGQFYPIRAVAKLVGMTTDSIRAWERRYEAIKPARSKGGRLYSDQDVFRLSLLKKAVDHGHSIGQIARLENADLEKLPLGNAEENERTRHRKFMEEREIKRIIGFLENYDMVAAERMLASLAALQSAREFVYTLVLPLMREVGNRWHSGDLSVAQEHMLSSILRNLLGTLLRINTREARTRQLLFTTPPGERHEFGILSAAMLTAGAGLTPIYLGADLPLEDTMAAVERTGADTLVLSLIPNGNKNEAHLEYFRSLHKSIAPNVDVIIGGSINDVVASAAKAFGFMVFSDMTEFEQYLVANGGVF